MSTPEPLSTAEQLSKPASSKPPPCDACRRRKVKCDSGAPCERCLQSGLKCTRDIIRKRRGPKKGSGSIIARLRQEDEQGLSHGLDDQHELPHIDLQFPALHYPGGLSPISPGLSDGFMPISDPSSQASSPAGQMASLYPPPTSVPLSITPGMPIQHGLYHPSPASSNEYVTVNDLAQQLFPTTPADLSTLSLHETLPPTMTPPVFPRFGAMNSNASSPTAGSLGSPPYDGPKFLYRSNSGLSSVEPQVALLAKAFHMSAHLMSQCITQYFRHLYPIMPIIHELTFRNRLTQAELLAQDEQCLVMALCAITVLHAAPHTDLSLDSKKLLGRQFLGHCHTIRQSFAWVESAGLPDIISSFFISVSYFELKKPRAHHFFLREAIGMAHEQGFHLESSYTRLSNIERIAYRRTFAVLFVTERGCAILRNKPTSISRLPSLPREHFEEEDENILSGFECLCQLFALLDEKFVELWRLSAPEDNEAMIQFDNIAALQHDLNAIDFDNIPLTDIQKADLLITHQWLRLIFWQASARQGLISGSAEEAIFRYHYPIVIAKDLCKLMQNLSLDSILVHGLGIVSLPPCLLISHLC